MQKVRTSASKSRKLPNKQILGSNNCGRKSLRTSNQENLANIKTRAKPFLILSRVTIISPTVFDRPFEWYLHTTRAIQPVINLTSEFANKILVLRVLN